MTDGSNTEAPIDTYTPPYTFNGMLHRVTVELKPEERPRSRNMKRQVLPDN